GRTVRRRPLRVDVELALPSVRALVDRIRHDADFLEGGDGGCEIARRLRERRNGRGEREQERERNTLQHGADYKRVARALAPAMTLSGGGRYRRFHKGERYGPSSQWVR